MRIKVTVLRGIPGSGKSTLARKLAREEGAVVVSADDFFVGADGVFRYDWTRQQEAHDVCLRKFNRLLLSAVEAGGPEKPPVHLVVDNTNLSATEVAPYYRLAQAYGAEVRVVEVLCDPRLAHARNVHGVALAKILQMEEWRKNDVLLEARMALEDAAGHLAATRPAAELLEARMVLEGAAARLAATRPAAELAPLEEAYRALEQAAGQGPFVKANALFHQRVAEAGGNRLLVVILTSLRGQIARLIAGGPSGETAEQTRKKILRTHGQTLEAIRAGDGAAAEHLSRQHLFDLYASLLGPQDRPRVESLLGAGACVDLPRAAR